GLASLLLGAELRELSQQLLLDALGAETKGRHLMAVALRTHPRQKLRGGAVMTADHPTGREGLVLVVDHRGIAMLAGELPATAMVGAGDVVGITAAVEEQENLPASPQGMLHDPLKVVGHQVNALAEPALLGHVGDMHHR